MPDVQGRRLISALMRAFWLPIALLLVMAFVFAAIHRLAALEDYRVSTDRVSGAVAIGLGALLVQRFTSAVLEWAARGAPSAVGGPVGHVLPLARRALSVAIFVIGILLVLDQLGVSISPLLAGLGISGIAVALALQPLLTNFFAGSYVLSDSSIRVGDHIMLQGGPSGHVESIGWRATRLRDNDGTTSIIVPNATLAGATVSNFGNGGVTLATVTMALPRGADLNAIETAAGEGLTALAEESVLAIASEPVVVRFTGVSGEQVMVLLGVRARSQADVPALTHEIVKRVVPRLSGLATASTMPS